MAGKYIVVGISALVAILIHSGRGRGGQWSPDVADSKRF